MYNGSFPFQGSETGSDFADFLLGIASSYAQGDSNSFYLRNKYAGLTHRTVGGQAEPDAELRLALGRAAAVAGEVQPAPDAGARTSSRWCIPERRRAWCFPAIREFRPRWRRRSTPTLLRASGWPIRPTSEAGRQTLGGAGKTSIRAGFGIFYTAFEGLSAGIMSANPPYGYDYNSFAPPLFATHSSPPPAGQNRPALSGSRSRPRRLGDESQHDRGLVASIMPITGCRRSSTGNVTPYSESYTLSVSGN